MVAAWFALGAFAAQIRFTGNTTASDQQINDALRRVAAVSASRLGCMHVEEVVAEVLPKDFTPPPAMKVTDAPAVYERWRARVCGKRADFLLTFWNAEGGMRFSVGHPFPD